MTIKPKLMFSEPPQSNDWMRKKARLEIYNSMIKRVTEFDFLGLTMNTFIGGHAPWKSLTNILQSGWFSTRHGTYLAIFRSIDHLLTVILEWCQCFMVRNICCLARVASAWATINRLCRGLPTDEYHIMNRKYVCESDKMFQKTFILCWIIFSQSQPVSQSVTHQLFFTGIKPKKGNIFLYIHTITT